MEQINKDLLDEASKRLGISTEKIQEAAKSGDIDGILKNLDENTAEKVKNLLGNKSAIKKLMDSPQAQGFLKNFLNK